MEIDRLNSQINQMKKVSLLLFFVFTNFSFFLFQVIVDKDLKIESQRAEMTGLRSKNFEFRSKIQEIQDKAKEKKDEKKKEERD